MNIQDIEYLLAIWEEGSFNKASKKLYISQPALSKCVRKIEVEFDITIFNRIPGDHSIYATREGELFYKYIKEVYRQHNEFLIRLQEMKEKSHRVIALGLSPRISQNISPKLLKWFNENHPEFYIRIREENSEQLEKDLENGSLDFALLSYHALNSSNIRYEVITEQLWYIYLRKGSNLAEKAGFNQALNYPSLSFRDLSDEPFSVSSPDHRSAQLIYDMEKQVGITLKKRIENNHLNRYQMAERGICSCFTLMMDFEIYGYDPSRIFVIDEKENKPIRRTIAYLPEVENSEKKQVICEGFRAILESY